MYEGAPNASAARPVLGHDRPAQGDAFSTQRRQRSARSCGWGEQWPAKHDLSSAAAAGKRGRADQSRSVDVVPQHDRPRPLPDRGHVVADGDGRHHDQSAARRDADQAGFVHAAVARHQARSGRRRKASLCLRVGRLPGDPEAVARHAAHDLRRQRAVPATVLVAESGLVFHGRWRAAGRGRLHLGDGPRG